MLAPAQGLKVYLINLDSSTDRRRHMERELAGASLAFERVAGIPGAALPEDLKPYFHDAQGRIASPLKLGEIGCHAAHLSAYRRFLASEADKALILEDDVRLPSDLGELLAELAQKLAPGWDVVRLANPPKRAYVPVDMIRGRFKLVRYSKEPTLASAYLLSRAGASKLLAPGLRLLAIDEYLRRPWLAGLDTCGIVPPPIQPMAFDSNIDAFEDRRRRPAVSFLRKAVARADLGNFPRRLRFELRNVGALRWAACVAINTADKVSRRFWRKTLIHDLSALLRR